MLFCCDFFKILMLVVGVLGLFGLVCVFVLFE